MTTASPQSHPLYLCLDQGGSRSRALVYDDQGQLLEQAEQPVATDLPAADRVEQQPLELLASLRNCAERVIAQLAPGDRQRLKRWGLCCQRSSLICVTPDDLTPITPVISWRDCRGAQQRLWTDSQQHWLRQRTGLRPSHHHGASKLCWLLNHHQQVIKAAAANQLLILPLASYLAAGLTGLPAKADPTNAQRTLLFNPHHLNWDPALLELFQLPAQILPPLQPCLADWGRLRVDNCELHGGYVGGDQGCALFADGAPLTTELKVNLGSGGFICLALRPQGTAQLSEQLLLSLAATAADQQQWMAEGTINGAGTALRWWVDYEQQQGNPVDEKQLFRQPLQPASGVFINTVSGLGSPFWRNDIESAFIDAQTPAQRYSAVVESILFLVRAQLAVLLETQRQIQQIRLSGGLSRINGLAQRLADLCQLPVLQTHQHEASGRGLAFLLANQPHDWPISAHQRYSPRTDPGLQQRYLRWNSLIEQLLRSD